MSGARIRAVSIAISCLLACACGSTVQISSSATDAAGDLDSNGPPGASQGSSSSTPPGHRPQVSSLATMPSADAPTPSGGSKVHTPGPEATTAEGEHVPGVTAISISIGLSYLPATAANNFNSNFGKNTAIDDLGTDSRALVDYFNRHGGVAGGRTLRLVEHRQSSANNAATEAQATCATYTQDQHVFVGLVAGEATTSCVTRAGGVAVQLANLGEGKAFMSRYPAFYSPGQWELRGAAAGYVDALVGDAYFARNSKIGVVYYDAPEGRDAYRNGMIPALQRHGLSVTQDAAITAPQSASEVGQAVADVQNAELKFATYGIDRVLFLDFSGTVTEIFMTYAQSQRYFPRYGLWSGSAPQYLQANVPAEQLRGAVGVGWLGTLDVDETRSPTSASTRLCDKILREAGITPSGQTARFSEYMVCTDFFFIVEALNAARSVSQAGFAAAVSSLGRPAMSAVVGYAEGYQPGKKWGAAAYRRLAFNDGCACFTYTSGNLPIK